MCKTLQFNYTCLVQHLLQCYCLFVNQEIDIVYFTKSLPFLYFSRAVYNRLIFKFKRMSLKLILHKCYVKTHTIDMIIVNYVSH